MIWFTTDFHLSHRIIKKYCNQPFKNVEAMSDLIIRHLKESVKSDDILYFLGDLAFKKETTIEFFDILEVIQIYYIIGNHNSKEVINIAR